MAFLRKSFKMAVFPSHWKALNAFFFFLFLFKERIQRPPLTIRFGHSWSQAQRWGRFSSLHSKLQAVLPKRKRTAPEEATLVSLDPFVISEAPFQFFITSHRIVALDFYFCIPSCHYFILKKKERKKDGKERETRKK